MAHVDKKLMQVIKQLRYSSFGFFFISFITPIISYKELNADGFEMGVLFSLTILGSSISSPIAGFLSDKRERRRKLIFGGSIGRFLAYLFIYFAVVVNNFVLMFIGTFILGVGAGFFWVPLRSIISDATEYRYRSEAFGVFSQQMGIGVMMGSFIGFFILGWASETAMPVEVMYSQILLYGVANIYAGIKVYKLIPTVTLIDIENDTDQTEEEKSGLKNNHLPLERQLLIGFIIILAVLFVENLIGSLVAPFLEVFLLKNITEDIMLMSLAYVPGGILSMMLAPKIGKLADKYNPRIWLAVTSALGSLTTWLLISSTEIWQFSLLFIVDATIVSSAGLVLSKIISQISRKRRGSLFGIQGGISNLGAIVGPIIGGILWETTSDKAPFLLSIFVELILAFLYPFVILLVINHIKASNGGDFSTLPLESATYLESEE
ncbi:MAG: MFS transporter [Candidatus Heimdallarchaeota archaeon]|nr:MFS transporter [Candidatus Heimdallarchaeota archaeon]MCK5049832.1 MFS transporter [Candidatus Heimdallarchaeota archaeon]